VGILEDDDDDEPVKQKTVTLVNRAAVRRYLLEHARGTRAHKFSRVSPVVFNQLEACVREKCRAIVHAQPGVGMTIK